MKYKILILLLVASSCTVNHYTCECKHNPYGIGIYQIPIFHSDYRNFTPPAWRDNMFGGLYAPVTESNDSNIVFRIENGRIGIGTTSPLHKLDIKTPVKIYDTLKIIK